MKINWKWLYRGMLAFMAACFGIYWGSMHWLKVSEHVVELPSLPEGLDGLRVLHITDLHSDNEKRMNVNIWKTIETLDFDIAVITGDMVIGKTDTAFKELTPHFDGLEALAARVPTFFVAGNHEYLVLREMIQYMESIGVTTLQDEACDVVCNGITFTIAGTLDDYHYRRKGGYDSLHSMMNGLTNSFTILLSHQPTVFDEVAAYAPGLTISGHTHGGQLRLPFLPTLYAPGQGFFPKYGDGFYENEETGAKLYISRGIGTTVFKMRFFNRPEITVLTLRAER